MDMGLQDKVAIDTGSARASGHNRYIGTVTAASFAGRSVDHVVALGRQSLAVQAPSLQFHAVGDRVRIDMPPDRCVSPDQ